MSGSAFWHVMVPTDRTNAVRNPSYELGTAHWTVSGTGVGVTRAFDPACVYDGVASLRGTSGATTGTWNIASDPWPDVRPGSVYTVSVYVVNHTNGTMTATLRALGTSVTAPIPPDGQWQRVIAVGPDGAGTPHGTLTIVKSVADAGSIGVDAWQCEIGTVATSYFDGDHEGAIWRGFPHLDSSFQPASARWGPLVSFASLGFLIEEHAGVGAPPMEPPVIPDAGPVAGTRIISLSGVLLGTSTASLHATRERLLRHLAPWDGDRIQPVRLAYTGAGVVWTMDAAYQGGLEMNDMSVASERVTVTMRASDPYWRAMRRIGGTAHSTHVIDLPTGTYASVLALDPRGAWHMLAQTPTIGTEIYHVNADRPGTVIVCGAFTTVNGTTAPRIAMIANGSAFPFAGQGGSLGIASGVAIATRWQPVGETYRLLVFGSNMATPGGTRSMLRYQFPSGAPYGIWESMYSPEGSAASAPAQPALIYDGLLYHDSDGTVIVAGDMPGGLRFVASGTASPSPHGTIDGWARAIAYLNANEIVVAGSFTSAGGTPCRHIASLNLASGRWGTYRWDPGTPIAALAVTPRTEIYAYVQHSDLGSIGHWHVRRGGAERLTGHAWNTPAAPSLLVARPFAIDRDGCLHAVLGTIATHRNNRFGAAGVSRPAWIGRWNRGVWEYAGVIADHVATYGMAISPDGTRYLIGKFEGLLRCDGVTMLYNTASAPTPLLVRIMTPYPAPVACVKLANLTTRRGVYGLLDGPAFDILTVDARNNTVTRISRCDMRASLDAASHPRNLVLAPGTNLIMVHAASGNQILCSWRPTALSPDGTL